MPKSLLVLNLLIGITDPSVWTYCKDVYKVCDSIIELSKECETTIVVNHKNKNGDSEAKFLPPRYLSNSINSEPLLSIIRKLKSPQVLTKNHLSCIESEHNNELICKSGENFIVAGFHLGVDIIPACLGLLDQGKTVEICRSAVGDLNDEYLENGLRYLSLFGIKIYDQSISNE